MLTQDVSVSYVMAGTAAGYLFFVGRRWRWWFAAALFVALVVPLVVSHTIWDLGHFLAATVGLVTTWIVKRWGVRPRMTWRGTAAGLQPRALPTWDGVNRVGLRRYFQRVDRPPKPGERAAEAVGPRASPCG